MTLPRFSVARLMSVVGVVAVNLAGCRALFSYDPELLAGLALPLIVIQVGVYWIVRRRGRVRVFWAGFVVFGLGAMGSLYWAVAYPKGMGRYVEPGTGRVVEQVTAGSAMWILWSRYFETVSPCFESLAATLRIDMDADGVGRVLMIGLVLSVPQLVVALAGGLVAWLAVERTARREPG